MEMQTTREFARILSDFAALSCMGRGDSGLHARNAEGLYTVQTGNAGC